MSERQPHGTRQHRKHQRHPAENVRDSRAFGVPTHPALSRAIVEESQTPDPPRSVARLAGIQADDVGTLHRSSFRQRTEPRWKDRRPVILNFRLRITSHDIHTGHAHQGRNAIDIATYEPSTKRPTTTDTEEAP